MPIFVIITLIISIALLVVWLRWRQAARADYIRTYQFPSGIFAKLQFNRAELTLKDCQLVARGLRQFFLAHLKSGGKFVAMPSQVAAELWRELTLHTQHYETFCNKAFGRFLHHTPAEAMSTQTLATEGIQRAWRLACALERINPKQPDRLPRLFALDGALNIPNGFRYDTRCTPGSGNYCASHIGCSSGCGGSSGSACADGDGASGGGGGSCGGGD